MMAKIIGTFGLLLGLMVRAYLIQSYWTWFISEPFQVVPINLAQATGIALILVLKAIFPLKLNLEEKENKDLRDLIKKEDSLIYQLSITMTDIIMVVPHFIMGLVLHWTFPVIARINLPIF